MREPGDALHGFGIDRHRHGELDAIGDVPDAKARARDDGDAALGRTKDLKPVQRQDGDLDRSRRARRQRPA